MQVAAETVVHLQSVHKRFGALHVLRGVSFSVTKGQVVAIIGKSGSGKSTALPGSTSVRCGATWASCSRATTCSRT